ncbi:MAG: glycosyltransferase family 39 protein [Candidatus Saccharibacteria bacterium]|nr:glycosyltransferase family 39 protein [Candidatus Saccharibacteria bacterium]
MAKKKADKKSAQKSNKKNVIVEKIERVNDFLCEKSRFYKEHRGRIFIVLFFAILFAVGMHFLPNVNGNFDENTEQNILLANVKDYTEALGADEITNAIHNKGIEAISVDPNRDHGVAPYYPFAPILALKGRFPHTVSVLWHFYTFCLAFIGVVFFYLLIQYLFKNKKLSVILTALYFFTPRIFIDSLHNNKDIVLMALLVVMIYFGVRFIREKKFRWAVWFAFVGAFVCNIKILGLFFVGLIGIGYIARLTIKKEWNMRNFLCGLTAVLLVFCLYLLLTPAIWGNGFALFEYIQYCLGNAVSFSANASVMFEGTYYNYFKNPLPWYYLPKLIAASIPIIISVLFVVSTIVVVVDFVKSIKNRRLSFSNSAMVLILLMFLVPLTFAMFSRPNLYNGWRHFYFLYPLMVLVGSYVVFRFKKYKKVSIVVISLIGLTIFSDVFCLFRYGMANTAYYNILLGTGNLADVYELDYYNVSSQEAFKQFLASGKIEENEDGLYYLYGPGFGRVVINDMKTYISPAIGQKIVVMDEYEIEKYQKEGRTIYSLSNPVYDYTDTSGYELVYSYKMFNSEVINFYKVKY